VDLPGEGILAAGAVVHDTEAARGLGIGRTILWRMLVAYRAPDSDW
jgi:hypothetical protein